MTSYPSECSDRASTTGSTRPLIHSKYASTSTLSLPFSMLVLSIKIGRVEKTLLTHGIHSTRLVSQRRPTDLRAHMHKPSFITLLWVLNLKISALFLNYQQLSPIWTRPSRICLSHSNFGPATKPISLFLNSTRTSKRLFFMMNG